MVPKPCCIVLPPWFTMVYNGCVTITYHSWICQPKLHIYHNITGSLIGHVYWWRTHQCSSPFARGECWLRSGLEKTCVKRSLTAPGVGAPRSVTVDCGIDGRLVQCSTITSRSSDSSSQWPFSLLSFRFVVVVAIATDLVTWAATGRRWLIC